MSSSLLVLCCPWFVMRASQGHSLWSRSHFWSYYRGMSVEGAAPTVRPLHFTSSLSWKCTAIFFLRHSCEVFFFFLIHLISAHPHLQPPVLELCNITPLPSCFEPASLNPQIWFPSLSFDAPRKHMLGRRGKKNPASPPTASGRHFWNCPSAKCKLPSISPALVVAGSNLKQFENAQPHTDIDPQVWFYRFVWYPHVKARRPYPCIQLAYVSALKHLIIN